MPICEELEGPDFIRNPARRTSTKYWITMNEKWGVEMASRDHFCFNFSCPSCGQNGVILFSENDYLFMTRNERRLEKLEGNFSGDMVDDDDAMLTCGI